ncbi:MAG: hypothetical protein O3B13_02475 [Planctomycetota bacterium]|nr:hypothetical protein [Planctomycetota bacterium]
MRGRVGRGDPDFGSDSFLDIIANLVGILVILIVLAGLRAAQVSVEPEPIEIAASEAASAEVPPVVESPSVSSVTEARETESMILPEPIVELGPDVMPLEFAEGKMRELRSTVAQLESRLARSSVDNAAADLKKIQAELADVSGRLLGLQQRLFEEDSNRRRALLAAADFDAEYRVLRQQLVEVNQVFEELATAERPVEELELRINPVGRRRNGTELLFRIENDQVVLLPATQLFGRAELQTGALTAMTRTSEIESGTAGPFEGVALDYECKVVAAMVPTSSGSSTYVLQKLMRGTVRVTRFAPSESWETAIAEQGIVSRVMLAAPRDAFARLFVTPDSFEAARRIAAFIRTLGHGVATQPIEAGSDIKLSYGVGSDAIVQ